MADYYSLLSGAVAKLPENSEASRRALYERVRGMLVAQMRSADPTISDAEIERECRSLEEAVDRVEAEAGKPPDLATPAGAAKFERRPRAAAPRRMATGIAVVACALAGAYVVYARFQPPTDGAPVTVVPAGDDAVTIQGLLAGYRGAASKPASVLLLHVRCGATIIERDAQSNAVNPSGRLDDEGRFSIAVKKPFLGEIIKVGVRAKTVPPDELHQDFLVLGFFAGDKLDLLTGAYGKTIKIGPQGQILNAGVLHMSSTIAPPLIVTRKSDGNIYASGGAFDFDEAC